MAMIGRVPWKVADPRKSDPEPPNFFVEAQRLMASTEGM